MYIIVVHIFISKCSVKMPHSQYTEFGRSKACLSVVGGVIT